MIDISFSLERFRTFATKATFDLAPLTIVTGPNGSGKSSMLKALILLKESKRKTMLNSLDFADSFEIHGLQDYEAVQSNGSEGSIVFSFRMNHLSKRPKEEVLDDALNKWPGGWVFPNKGYIELRYDPNHLQHVELGSYWEGKKIPICTYGSGEVEVPISHPDFEGATIPHPIFSITVNPTWYYLALGGTDENVSNALDINKHKERDALLKLIKEKSHYGDVGLIEKLDLSGLITAFNWHVLERENKALDHLSNEVLEFRSRFYSLCIQTFLAYCGGSFAKIIDGIEYPRSFRWPVKDIYTRDELSLSTLGILNTISEQPELLEKVNPWIRRFGVGDSLIVRKLIEGVFQVQVEKDGRVLNLKDIGYGQAQLIPLCLFLLNSPHGTTLLLEEPEAHLHPSLQSKLGDLMVDLIGEMDSYPGNGFLPEVKYEDGVLEMDSDALDRWQADEDKYHVMHNHMIVETHSEYLIRRLQYLVAKGKAKPERIVIYYFGSDPTAQDYIRRIDITENGQLSDEFGPGFLDESSNLMIDLFKLGKQN